MLKLLCFHHHMILDPPNFNNNSTYVCSASTVAPVYVNLGDPSRSGTWCDPVELTEDSPLPFIDGSSLRVMSTGWHHPAVHLFCQRTRHTSAPGGPIEQRDKGVLRSRQHSGTEPRSTFTWGTLDPECSDIIGLEIFTAQEDQTLSIISSDTCKVYGLTHQFPKDIVKTTK